MEVKIRLAGPPLGTGEPGTRIDTVGPLGSLGFFLAVECLAGCHGVVACHGAVVGGRVPLMPRWLPPCSWLGAVLKVHGTA